MTPANWSDEVESGSVGGLGALGSCLRLNLERFLDSFSSSSFFFFCIFPGCKWAAWGGGVYDSVVVGHPAVRGATATPCQTRRRMSVHRMERAQGDASVTSGWR